MSVSFYRYAYSYLLLLAHNALFYWHFRERLEVFQTGVSPFLGILQLYVEQGIAHLPFRLMTLHVLLSASVPKVAIGFYHSHTHVVSHAELLPEGAAR